MHKKKQPSAFVWYHAPNTQEGTFKQWISHLEASLKIQVKLYKRIQNEKTTFMEVFEHIDSATIINIEQLATQQTCFNGIHRQCESFERITIP